MEEELEGAGVESDSTKISYTSTAQEGGQGGVVNDEEKHLLHSICSNTLVIGFSFIKINSFIY